MISTVGRVLIVISHIITFFSFKDETEEIKEGNVQKKVIPWRLMTPQDTNDEDLRKVAVDDERGLILVTSLINKLPNLGGLCRTSEIFSVKEMVVNSLRVMNEKSFESVSVSSHKWLRNVREVITYTFLCFEK